MENRIGRSVLVVAMMAAGASLLLAQDASQNPYQGVSRPPANDQIITTQNPEPKPPAGHPYDAQPAATVQAAPEPAPQPAPNAGEQQINPTDPASNSAYPSSPSSDP